MFLNVHQVGLATITVFILHNQTQTTVPNCDVSFANSELHQAYGHIMLTMSTSPKYGHRSLVRTRTISKNKITQGVNLHMQEGQLYE